MNKESTLPRCPKCGASIPPGTPEALCPHCLLQAAVAPTVTDGGAASDVLPLVEIARLFPQWEIVRLIGRGGMGAVYLVRQPNLDRLVALKILKPPTDDRAFAERFTREAQTLAKLNHPNIVTVHDFGAVEGHYFLLMEYVDGINLRELMQTQRIAPAEALSIVPRVCEALQHAHEHGVVHRDIKPENILLDKQGRVKIADFGIAKIVAASSTRPGLTQAQERIGTPHYMAPEQIEKPQLVDHRADIYSLGVVFYELLTGELPLGRFAPPSQRVQVDVRLDEVVLQALEKEPARRYQQAREVQTAVETIASAPPPSPPAAAASSGAPGSSGGVTRNNDGPPESDASATSNDVAPAVWDSFRHGWTLLRSDPFELIGITLVAVMLAALSNSLLLGLLDGPLLAGLGYYVLQRLRGQPVTLETVYARMKSVFFPLLVGGVITGAVFAGGVLLPLFLLAISHGRMHGPFQLAVIFVLPGIFFSVAWQFALLLIIDRRIDCGSAIRLSQKIIVRHWFTYFGLMTMLQLPTAVALALVAARQMPWAMFTLIAGGCFYAALACAAGVCAYERVFGRVAAAPGEPSTAPHSKPSRAMLPFALVCVAILIFAGVAITRWRIDFHRLGRLVRASHYDDLAAGQPTEPQILDIARFVRPFTALGKPDHDFDSLLGRQTIDELPFQIDGAAALDSQVMREKYGDEPHPDQLHGIRAGLKFDELQVLHFCKFEQTETEGDEIARIRFNYADGSRAEFPVLFGGHVRDFIRTSYRPEELSDPDSRVIWRGHGPPPDQYRPPPSDSRLFKSVFRNPHPDRVVDTIDVLSAQKPAAYCLVAATIASHDPDRSSTPLIEAK